MTIRQELEARLVSVGMFPQQATEVMESVLAAGGGAGRRHEGAAGAMRWRAIPQLYWPLCGLSFHPRR